MNFIYFYFWLHWVFVAAHGLSLVMAGGDSYCLVAMHGLLIAEAFLVVEHKLQARRLRELWRTGLVAPCRLGSSQTRD